MQPNETGLATGDPRLNDEAGRQAAVDRYEIVDTLPEDQFDRITDLVRTVLRVPMSTITLIDRDRQWFKSRAGVTATETPRSIAFCDRAIRTHAPLVVEDAREHPMFRDNPLVTGEPNVVAYAGVPLRSPDGYNIGTLCAIDVERRAFSAEHIDVLGKLAAIVVDELELRRIAASDALTGLLSRRAMLQAIETTVRDGAEGGIAGSLILLDIDHFKTINDAFGHPAGDEVLRSVARSCVAEAGNDAMVGRLGGEEFALLLPRTGAPEALALSDRLRAAVSALQLDVIDARRVTISAGVSTAHHPVGSVARWLSIADALLYDAKRAGRDRSAGAILPPL
ncbi:diguanylate cyclase [Rhizorhabdus sp.]|jgi:diguanylate cyclase (GGDEF)-like protein|uniref:GGDEF domain-containing protein n=1 Tax=Rhizorhabdus sp. TaxID=1968843 RepID=UPI001B6A061F|nr:sensor domain-containing diguanylate cyclase [Rhizorhabdus sp.]MBP8231826.1 sensor domain-containing diguanylate cyclase [Rhizorhabdus sp.]